MLLKCKYRGHWAGRKSRQLSGTKPEKTSAGEMLSFGGIRFASGIYMAFLSYYLMVFCTDVALIPAAATAVLLLFNRLFNVVYVQSISLFMNRVRFKAGKYRPYFKWCALPFSIALVALGLTPEISPSIRVIYASFMLILCELTLSTMYMAAMSMLPYFARDDVARTNYVSFGNGSAILAFIIVGTLMLPMVDFFGADDRSKGFALTLALFAVVAAPLYYNAYFRLKERYYDDMPGKSPAMKDILSAIGRNRRFMLFLAGFCIYYMADTFKNLTTYYYLTYNMERPDLVPVIIMAGLISPLAVQPIIPRLLAFARKESLIVFGLFAASCVCLLMLAAGNRPFALIACVVLYGVFTAVVANLVFTVLASFTDEMRTQQNMNVSEILTATMGLSSNIGIAIASGIAPVTMAAFGYSALANSQTANALTGIKTLYILCTATGMALAGYIMLLSHKKVG